MGSARELLMERCQAWLDHFEVCKELAYEHPEYKKHFEMAHNLSDFIINEFEAGNLDGKDLYDCPIVLEDLFNLHKDENKRQKAMATHEKIKLAIKQYLNDEDA